MEPISSKISNELRMISHAICRYASGSILCAVLSACGGGGDFPGMSTNGSAAIAESSSLIASSGSQTNQQTPISSRFFPSASTSQQVTGNLAAECGGTPCITPSQTQSSALFGKIEQRLAQILSAGSPLYVANIGEDVAMYKTYGSAAQLGLATYLGGLWYANGSGLHYYSTLDEGNKAFCNGQCWTSPAVSPLFTMTQTLSDNAQATTLAFSGLAMVTGNLEAQTFFPPGKVADYTGFQYLRDNDPDNMGHNTSFLTRVANNIIFILNDAQFAQLKALASTQIDQIDLYGYKRYPLMKAFRRLLDNDIPSGSEGLNLDAVKKASRELYLLDGQISFDRALVYAQIINSLDSTQLAYLDAMKGKGWNSWPNISDAQIRSRMSSLQQGTAVAVMTYAGDLFSWYAGSVEADVYFCPERHGTYFGSFYIKDAPAIGHEGYGINEQLTATAGSALSDSSKGYVTKDQAVLMTGLVTAQAANLYANPSSSILKVRTDIATLLRSLLSSKVSSDVVKARVLDLSATYGELDGANNHAYANAFAKLNASLSSDQRSRLTALRKSIMSGTYSDGTAFDYSTSRTMYLYSNAITNVTALAPYIANTDYLFFAP